MLRWALIAVVGYLLWRMFKKQPPPAELSAPQGALPPHEVLGLEPDASPAEIKAAYQKAIRENHPDRVADMSEDIRALAEKKTREATVAYDAIRED